MEKNKITKLRSSAVATEPYASIKNLDRLKSTYQLLSAQLAEFAENEFDARDTIFRQDACLQEQQDLLKAIKDYEVLSLEDVLAKFDIWLEDYLVSAATMLPESNEALLLKIHEDLEQLVQKQS